MKKKKHAMPSIEDESPHPVEETAAPLEPEALSELAAPEVVSRIEELQVEPLDLPTEEPVPAEPEVFEAALPTDDTPAVPPEQPADSAPAAEVESVYPRKAANPWLAPALVGLITLFLSVCLTLAVLGAANGVLRYASKSQVLLLESEVASLSTRLEEQSQDLTTLRTRLQALEALENRVTGMQQESTELRQEMDAQTAAVEQMQADLQAAQTELESISESSRDFQAFMKGLSELLTKLETTQETIP